MTIPDTMAAITKLETLLRELLRGEHCFEFPSEGMMEVYVEALKWCVETRVGLVSLFPPVPLATAGAGAPV